MTATLRTLWWLVGPPLILVGIGHTAWRLTQAVWLSGRAIARRLARAERPRA